MAPTLQTRCEAVAATEPRVAAEPAMSVRAAGAELPWPAARPQTGVEELRTPSLPVAARAARTGPREIYVNGKFLARRVTGTERYSRELITAVDALLPPSARWTVLCPPGAQPPPLARIALREVGPPGLPLHLWEQLVLPTAARGGRLVNLGGTSPWLGARRSVSVIHDAAVFDRPEAFTRLFVSWYRRGFRHLARRDTRLLTVSTFSRDRLCAALGTPASRWTVVPNGGDHMRRVASDAAAVERLGLGGCRVLLAVATANANKNIGRLVDAFARLEPSPSVRLVIVGGRNDAVFASTPGTDGDVQAQANPASALPASDPPGVVRTGPVDDATLKALYLHARALVFPSVYEGFGLPPLEAMTLGCPVVAARSASLPEVCGDAVLYVDPRSVDSIAEALRRVLTDDALVSRLAIAGRDRATRMSWQASARALLDALDHAD